MAHYKLLISEEISGSITPENQAELERAKTDYPRVYNVWKKKHAVFRDKKVRLWLDQPPTPSPDKPSSKDGGEKLIIIAVLIAIGLYLFSLHQKKTPFLSKTLELRLENGQVIDLSQEGKTATGKISLIKYKDSLSYSLNTDVSERAELSVPVRKRYKITLSDGTEVFMNAATRLKFPTSFTYASTREITIDGEAYLKIAKDAKRPFIVHTGDITVEVLGTEFNVNSYNTEYTEVAVVAGKVRYKAGRESVILHPGRAATNKRNSIQTRAFDADTLLGWRNGVLVFRDKPLEEIIKDIRRQYDQLIILDDQKLAGKLISSRINLNDSLEKNLHAFPIGHYMGKDSLIHIK